jgi:sensor histidine kinase regulating citrate/malate metabolism
MIITIADNGAGFEPEAAESFFKSGFSTKHRDSGIGLTQCRKIIEKHSGQIRLESEGIGMGARAIIELPTAS